MKFIFKKTTALTFFFFSILYSATSQDEAFLKAPIGYTMGGKENDRGIMINKTSDGNLLIIGFTQSFSNSQDLLIIKTDLFGKTLWRKTMGSGGSEFGWDFEEVDEGKNYLIAGFSDSYGKGDEDITLYKITRDGQEVWIKHLPYPGDERCWSILKLWDGNFLISGQTRNRNTNDFDGLITKIDSVGSIIWQHKVGNLITYERLYYSLETADRNLLITGISRKDSSSENTGLVILFDQQGKEIKRQFLTNYQNTTIHGILPLPQKNILIYGYAQADTNKAARNIYLSNFSNSGDVKWEKVIGGGGREVHGLTAVTGSKRIYIIGYERSLEKDSFWNAVLYVVSSKGKLKERRVFGGNKSDRPYTITKINNSRYASIGTTESFGNGKQDVWLFFTDKKGKLIR
jgi:hypothetical protein